MNDVIRGFVLNELKEAKGRWAEIADETGIPLSTVRKIGYGEVQNPGVKVMDQLCWYFGGRLCKRKRDGEHA